MLWLVVLAVSITVVSGINNQTKVLLEQIIAPSAAGGLVIVAIVVITATCLGCYYYRRVKKRTSPNGEESRSKKGERQSLMSHENHSDYDSPCNHNSARRDRRRINTPPATLVESQYSEIRRENIVSQRLSHSRSETPTETMLMRSGDESGNSGGGGVLSSGPDGNLYSYVRGDKARFAPSRPRGMSVQRSDASDTPLSLHSATRTTRVTTSIHQSLKHCQSGTYVLPSKERTRPIEPVAEQEEEPVYDRLSSQQEHIYDKLSSKYDKTFFETEKDFWSPAQTTSELYSQFNANRYREIPRQSIIVLEQLGSGQFGTVHKGLWVCEGEPLHVAVKTLQQSASEEDGVKFLQEAGVMGQFSHPNIVGMYGVVTVTAPTLIILELATTDLHRYLRGIRMSEQYTDHLPRQLLQFTCDVACGMEYLSKKQFVHRDLAARNVLLDFSLVCKIGDFGMARYLMNEQNYTSTENRPLPVKWMSPEALLHRTFSTASDVWSFGLLAYEIWSVGRKPHEQLTNQQVIDGLQDHHCHPPPPGCPRAIYTLMVDCWHPEPSERISFQQLYKSLCQPEDYLLSWSDDIPASAKQLGADHTHSENLHSDLQNKYLVDSSML